MQENEEESVTKMPFLATSRSWAGPSSQSGSRRTRQTYRISEPHVIKQPERLLEITTEKEKEFAKVNRQYAEGSSRQVQGERDAGAGIPHHRGKRGRRS